MKITEKNAPKKKVDLFAKLPTLVKVPDGGRDGWVVVLVTQNFEAKEGFSNRSGVVLLRSDYASSVGYVSRDWHWHLAEAYEGEITLTA